MACVSVKSSIEINHNLISVSELLGELKMLLLKRKNVFALWGTSEETRFSN